MSVILKYIAGTLTLIGGLNWGLIGMFGFDVVAYLFGDMTMVSRIIYILVAISAIWTTFYVGCEAKKETRERA